MKRTKLREQTFRILFGMNFFDHDQLETQMDLYFSQHPDFDRKDRDYIRLRCENIISKLPQIDELLEAYSKDWSIQRIGKAELTILRLAAYEIHFDDDIPRKVAINEAVELSKKYCNEKAAPFINGVLGRIEAV